MITELEHVRRLRPAVARPTSEARRAALGRLHTAITTEGAGDAAQVPTGLGGEHTQPAGFEPGVTGYRGLRSPGACVSARRGRWVAERLAVLVALATTLLVAGGAVILLAHGRQHAATPGSSTGARGQIIDDTGMVLQASPRVTDVLIRPPALPHSAVQRDTMFDRLATLLGISTTQRRCRLSTGRVVNLAPVACAVARANGHTGSVLIAPFVSTRLAQHVRLAGRQLPGVLVSSRLVRFSPQGNLGASVLGTIGTITPSELGQPQYAGARPGSIVGQDGLEAYYDRFLRAGDNLKLELDAHLQRVAQRSLARSIAANHGAGGAFVAMNPQSGAVYAVGSEPSSPPGVSARPTAQTHRGDKLLDRAIQSEGPVGSTFAPITAIAALQSDLWSPNDTFDDTGHYCVGAGATEQCRQNAGNAVYGQLDLANAIKVSSDDFFFHLGALLNAPAGAHPAGGALQQWARSFGIGQATGIDLPGEVTGTLPTPRWREQRNQLERECDTASGPFRYTDGHGQFGPRELPGWRRSPTHPPGGCGIADGTSRPWSVGDAESLAVGQGDVQITPLQLAVAYAAIANGGTIVRPHIAADIQTGSGTIVQPINPHPRRHLHISPATLQTIRQGLRAAASDPGGTTDDVFGNFAQPVYGQAGTAQYAAPRGVERNYAWYAGFVPASATSKPIVVVVWVPEGGFGAVAAAPVARQILSQWFFKMPGRYQPGASHTL